MATKIIGIRRLEDTFRTTGGSGDNWHTTWAANDAQYTGICDGKGWPEIDGYTGVYYNTRVLEIEGGPEQPRFRHLPGFPELLNIPDSSDMHRYYGFGIIALDQCIYQYLSTPNHMFLEPGAKFVGAKLIYSPDLGRTWRNQDGTALTWEPWAERNKDNMAFFEEDDAFTLITVLQMGKNYEHNEDGYVYLYSPNGSVDGKMNELALCRVRKESLLDRASYEFFVSRNEDGSANWSRSIGDRGAVHTFPAGWVNVKYHPYAWHPSVVYNQPLGKYMMANWGMATSPEDGMWFDRPSYLGFWIADQPWGPWTQIHEDTAWMPGNDPAARAYQPQIMPKWIAPDGKSFWLAWTDFQVRDDRQPYYCFNWQQVEILTE